jgi:hypothetical protein
MWLRFSKISMVVLRSASGNHGTWVALKRWSQGTRARNIVGHKLFHRESKDPSCLVGWDLMKQISERDQDGTRKHTYKKAKQVR